MAELKTDYKDQLLDSLVNTKRVYNLVDADGNVVRENVSLEDVTVYSQDGDYFGAADINKTNEMINQVNRNLQFPDGTKFYPDIQDGKYGFNTDPNRGADTFSPFSNFKRYYSTTVTLSSVVKEYELGFRPKFFMIGLTGSNAVFWYDEVLNKHYYNGHINNGASLGSWINMSNNNLSNIIEITDIGFKAQIDDAYSDSPAFIIAFG